LTIGRRKILNAILDRVSEPGDQIEVAFLSDEVDHWQPTAVSSLISAKLLKTALLAEAIICGGCEERCHRPVMLIPASTERSQMLISTCNLKPDMGPFEHYSEQLSRWTSSRELVAKFVGRSVRLRLMDNDVRWRRVRFGALQIEEVQRGFSLEFGGAPIAIIGSLRVPLIELLEWDEAGIAVSQEALALFASQSNDVQAGNKRFQPSTSVRDDNKQMTALKVRRLQGYLEKLASRFPNLNKEQLVKKLMKSGEHEGLSAARILRVTCMPTKK